MSNTTQNNNEVSATTEQDRAIARAATINNWSKQIKARTNYQQYKISHLQLQKLLEVVHCGGARTLEHVAGLVNTNLFIERIAQNTFRIELRNNI